MVRYFYLFNKTIEQTFCFVCTVLFCNTTSGTFLTAFMRMPLQPNLIGERDWQQRVSNIFPNFSNNLKPPHMFFLIEIKQ